MPAKTRSTAMIQRIDHYKLIAELKRGQTVTVYRAFDEKLERFVLLKVLQSTDPATRERFTQEACILARLRHPNIVQVFNYGDTGTQSGKAGRFLAMEYIEGSSLAEILRHHKLPLDLVIYFGREILQALAAAHRHQIVHRDIKPQNILVDTEGRVKVTDFGLASVIGSEGRATGIIVGTPQYMSPEQAQGECATPASDLFSLGVVMYEMLSGFSPFDGETIPERMYRVVHERPVPLAQIVPSDSHKLIACVDHLLEKEPAKRPANAEQAIRELDRCETALQLNAQPVDFCRFLEDPEHYVLSRKRGSEPPAKRKRVAGALWVSALAAIVVLLVAGGLWQILRSKTGQETLPPASVLVTDSADGNSPPPGATSHQENLSAATGSLASPRQPESSDRPTKGEPVQKAEVDFPAMSREHDNDDNQPQAAQPEGIRRAHARKTRGTRCWCPSMAPSASRVCQLRLCSWMPILWGRSILNRMSSSCRPATMFWHCTTRDFRRIRPECIWMETTRWI